MDYIIYIDESGSINQHSKGIFEIAFLIIKKEDLKKTEKFFRKKILNFKKNNSIANNVELKAHYLKKNNFLDFVDYIFHTFLNRNRVVSAYIDNRSLSSNKNGSNERFFKMIEFIIERCKDRKYLSEGDSIEIHADQRNNIVGEIKKLKNNSNNIYGIDINSFSFEDSSKNTLIQIADIVSFKCNRIIINALKTIIQLHQYTICQLEKYFTNKLV